ncbi:MAG: OmpH family outer membrane protein [Gemmatimonadetes bacterium]|nr:OmpH family outer membrane protein [Gemmatimonadota bacterium]
MARSAFWGLLSTIAVALIPAAALAQGAPAGARIAWVDLQTVLKQSPEYAVAESTFKKEMDGMQKEVEKLQQQFDSTLNEYNKQAVVLSPSAKQSKETQLRNLQQTLQQRASDFQSRAQQREQELIGPIERRVQGIIEGLRAERNLSIIFDVSAQGSNIIAADKSLDLTATVMQRLKAPSQ